MNGKAPWIVIALLVSLWIGAALLTRAETIPISTQRPMDLAKISLSDEPLPSETLPSGPTIPPEPSPTATPETPGIQVSLTGGPATLCPGYRLYYTFRLTNTSSISPLSKLVITDFVPLGTWFAPGELGGTISGTYDVDLNAVIWKAAVVNPGQMVEARLTLRTYSSLRTGTVITNTFTYTATELQEPGEASVVSVVDIKACPATSTPTATATRTATATPTLTPTEIKPTETPTPPTQFQSFLPLLYK